MRLLIVSHTEHYSRDGELVGHGATLRELDHLATLFDEVVHVAPLHGGEAPHSALPYAAPNLEYRAIQHAGGDSLSDKARILARYPQYARVIWQELERADAVHVRCPANVSLLAAVLLALRRHPSKKWIKYAGNWEGCPGEALSYRFQRWWLQKDFARASVSVNGSWPDQPEHVHTFLNPCLTAAELMEGRRVSNSKELREPVKLLYVGRISRDKGVERSLRILAGLKEKGVNATFSLVGEGPERCELEEFATTLDLQSNVIFHGGVPRDALPGYYHRSHFFIMPTTASEGWPKVLSEAMAYGVVPLSSRLSSIPQYLHQFGTGCALDPENLQGYIDAITTYLAEPDEWHAEAERGIEAAELFSYGKYLAAVERLYFSETSSGKVELWPITLTGSQ